MTKDEAYDTLNEIRSENDFTDVKTMLVEVMNYITDQPEIVRCEDCKYSGNKSVFCYN